jgi:hypothetical protein
MARKNLKPKKFRGGGSYQGGRTDTPPGAAKAGPVERPGNYQEKQITGPVDNQAVTCPPGYINVGGQCVKQASKVEQ